MVKPILFLGPTFFLTLVIDKQPLKSLGFSGKNFIPHFLLGLFGAICLISYNILIQSIKTHSLALHPSTLATSSIALIFATSLATGLIEEIVYRGYMFQRLQAQSSTPLALIASTVFFALVHVPRAVITLHMPITELLAHLFLLCYLGTINGLLFWKTKSLTASTTLHTLWNFSSAVLR